MADQASTSVPMQVNGLPFGADAAQSRTAARTARGPGHAVMDETNAMILRILAHKGRTSLQEISDTVQRSESTVRERVGNLERQGILLGCEARIDWARVGLPLEVVLEAECPPDKAVEVARALRKVPQVVQAIVTTGSPNLLAVLRARDMRDVQQVMAGLSCLPLQALQVRVTMEELVLERPPHPPVGEAGKVRDMPPAASYVAPAPYAIAVLPEAVRAA